MIGTPAQLRAASTVNTVAVADANLKLSSKLKSLCVILDSRLSFDAHVAMVCKTCNYHIWVLRHIRRLLPLDVARTLACSVVGARLDYCNSVLYGALTSSIQKFQRVQNSLARVLLQQPRILHARPLLRSLHWLPVSQRIVFKVAALTYKIRSILLVQHICTRCCRTTAADLRRQCGRHLGRFYTYHELELSMAVAPLVSLHHLYGTVCLLTLLTLHH